MESIKPARPLPIDKEITSLLFKQSKEIKQIFKLKQTGEPRRKEFEATTFKKFIANKLQVISVVRSGVSIQLFGLISKETPFTEEEWADFLGISTKSLQRYRKSKDHTFKSIHSEKILELSEVTILGVDLFGDLQKFKAWLETPNFSLGNITPLSLLKDSFGKEMVVSELTRVSHGIFV